MEINDWRLFNQDQYLQNKILIKIDFIASSNGTDHVHCEFCWAKFSSYPKDLHEGYTTTDGKYWICCQCFNDFVDLFQWKVIKKLSNGSQTTGNDSL